MGRRRNPIQEREILWSVGFWRVPSKENMAVGGEDGVSICRQVCNISVYLETRCVSTTKGGCVVLHGRIKGRRTTVFTCQQYRYDLVRSAQMAMIFSFGYAAAYCDQVSSHRNSWPVQVRFRQARPPISLRATISQPPVASRQYLQTG
jgi:hypothetical protein